MSASILRESNAPTKEGRSQKSAESRRLDLIMAANVQTALATKVQELSGVFRKKQTEYLRRELLFGLLAAREALDELVGGDRLTLVVIPQG